MCYLRAYFIFRVKLFDKETLWCRVPQAISFPPDELKDSSGIFILREKKGHNEGFIPFKHTKKGVT